MAYKVIISIDFICHLTFYGHLLNIPALAFVCFIYNA